MFLCHCKSLFKYPKYIYYIYVVFKKIFLDECISCNIWNTLILKKNIGYFKFKFDCTSYFLPGSPTGVGTCQAIWEDDVPGEHAD